MHYLVSYDLRNAARRNYDTLIDALRVNLRATPLLESVWLVENDLPPAGLRDYLLLFMDDRTPRGDRIIVARVEPFDSSTVSAKRLLSKL